MNALPAFTTLGQGPTVLMLHGIGGGHLAFAPQVETLAGSGYRAVAWDMPGYGRSAPIEPYTFKGLAQACVDLIESLRVAAANLVGHSMGGMVALEMAARHPGRVAGLVLACCTPAFGAQGAALQQDFLARRLGPLDEGASMRELAIQAIAAMVGPGADPRVVHDAVDLMGDIPPATYRAAVAALLHFDQRAALARLAMPALVVAGRHDAVSRPLVLRRMAERMAAARYVELDAGHFAPFEAPAAFAREVQAFLGGLDHESVT